MELNIYPYKISRRTKYSKLHVYDMRTNKDIIDYDYKIINKIINDYNEQIQHPEDYFEISDNCLLHVKDAVDLENIEYLFIPENIVCITNYAIEYRKIKLVSLPSSLKLIKRGAFHGCHELECIDIPSSVDNIEFHVFEYCGKLNEVKLPNITTLSEELFLGCKSLKNIILPETIDTIKDSAFYGCESLEYIKLPENLKVILKYAFAECSNLKKINLPEKLEIIDECAFWTCNSLEKIIIPDSVKSIGKNAFFNCTNLKYVKLSKNIKILPDRIFASCSSLAKIDFLDNITTFGDTLFFDVGLIENINIPKNLKTFSRRPFYGSNIKSITFNYDLKILNFTKTTYDDDCEYDLVMLSKINKLIISNNVKIITPDAFKMAGNQIKKIDYLGSKEEFEVFKNNNKKLFDFFTDLKNINIIENKTKASEIKLER